MVSDLTWVRLERWNVSTKVFRSVKTGENSFLVKCGDSFETYFSFTSNLFLDVRYGYWYTDTPANHWQTNNSRPPARSTRPPITLAPLQTWLAIVIFWAHGELRITEIMKSPSTMYWIWQVLSGKPCFQLSISNDFKSETLRHHEGNSPKWITIGFQGPKVETPNITKQRFRLQLGLYAKVQWRPKTLSWPPKFQINSVILIENL